MKPIKPEHSMAWLESTIHHLKMESCVQAELMAKVQAERDELRARVEELGRENSAIRGEAAMGWTKCSDELPLEDMRCLVSHRRGRVDVMSFLAGMWFYKGRMGDPTHWMPLPEPPSGA